MVRTGLPMWRQTWYFLKSSSQRMNPKPGKSQHDEASITENSNYHYCLLLCCCFSQNLLRTFPATFSGTGSQAFSHVEALHWSLLGSIAIHKTTTASEIITYNNSAILRPAHTKFHQAVPWHSEYRYINIHQYTCYSPSTIVTMEQWTNTLDQAPGQIYIFAIGAGLDKSSLFFWEVI